MTSANGASPVEIDEHRIRQVRRVCLFAHYHQDGIVAVHVLHYLRALRDAGFVTVVLSTASLDTEGCDALRNAGADVILRENRGMDFGGWIEACRRFFPLRADLLLLANDSVYGPLSDLSAFVDRLLAHEADFYGAVESQEIAPHLQSWFVMLRPAAYRSRAFTELMCTPMPEMADKLALVTRYEVGLTQHLAAAGLRYYAAFSLRGRDGIARRYPYNPAHLLWREMIDAGVPFVKIELLRLNRMRVTDTAAWPIVVGSHTPDLVAMIEADLTVRRPLPRPGFGMMSAWPQIYWPEIRATIVSDYHASPHGRGITGLLHLAVARSILALTRVPRRLHARWLSRQRPSQPSDSQPGLQTKER